MTDMNYQIRKFFRNEHVQAITVALVLAGLVYLTMKFGAAVLVVATIPIGYGFHWLWRNFAQIRRLYRQAKLTDEEGTPLRDALAAFSTHRAELRELKQRRLIRELQGHEHVFNDVLSGDVDYSGQAFTARSVISRIGQRLDRARAFSTALFDARQRRLEVLRTLGTIDDEIATAEAGLNSLDQPVETESRLAA